MVDDMEITNDVINQFREYYSEFASTTTYPDALVKKSLNRANNATAGSIWGAFEYSDYNASTRAEALFAYAAHALTLEKKNFETVKGGGFSSAVMPVSGKSVGDESESYTRAAFTSEKEALGSTQYGQDYLALYARLGFIGRML